MENLNIIRLLAEKAHGWGLSGLILRYEDVVFALLAVILISAVFGLAARRLSPLPSRAQAFFECIVSGADGLLKEILGGKSRKYLPFIGTLFIYILVSNLMGFIPFMKSPTTSFSMTLALALCVFSYVQYTAVRELGLKGYVGHLAGNPTGALAATLILPLFMLMLHLITELVRPLSLALRLRSNIFSDDMLVMALSGLGFFWLPLLFFSVLLGILAAVVQAAIFSILSAVYFALVVEHE